ncbi:GH32 C-terminal domain-containing protein [Paenibacillus rhizoplanae]
MLSDGTRRGKASMTGGTWQWGGHLVVHEVVQGTDGALLVKVPDTLNAAFNQESALSFTEVLGRWKFSGSTAAVTATDSFAGAYAGPLPDGACKLEATITFAPGTRGCGIILRTDQEFGQGYMIRLEPGRNRIVVDQWPRKGDVPYAVGMERPLQLLPGTACSLSIYLEDQVCVVYVNEELALSTRLYDFQQGGMGLFVSEGSAEFITRQFAM